MSVVVKHLNADSSFLLTFSPEPYPSSDDLMPSYEAYTILIDPWLTGESIVTAPWFAVTKHTTPSCIQHLSQIEEPDVVVISQNKPDHCHEATLRQLSPDGKAVIAAEPGAAKVIKKWSHFDPARVIPIPKYHPNKRFPCFRIHLPPLSRAGRQGEIQISFIPAKNYLTGLHNAIGITYQPPTHFKSVAPISTFELPSKAEYLHGLLSPISLPPLSPPPPTSPTVDGSYIDDDMTDSSYPTERTHTADAYSHPLALSRSSQCANSKSQSFQPQSFLSPNLSRLPHGPGSPPFSPTSIISTTTADFPSPISEDIALFQAFAYQPPTPESPDTIHSGNVSQFHKRNISTPSYHSSITPGRPRPVSVLYSPHGIPFSDLLPYVQHHLVKLGALPLTLLLHSFDKAENPWLLGGNIMAGSDGGVEIARRLMAHCWISAHDEAKDKKGFSVGWLKEMRMTPKEVQKALWTGEEGEWLGKKGWNCDVRSLEVGAEIFVGQTRDLVSSMEEKGEFRYINVAHNMED